MYSNELAFSAAIAPILFWMIIIGVIILGIAMIADIRNKGE